MNYYKISKDNWSVTKTFNTLQEAQTFADSLGDGYTVEFISTHVTASLGERLYMDMDFGNELFITFLEDNRSIQMTPSQSKSTLSKFRDIMDFSKTGAITAISASLPSITTDDIFTQDRKDKYTKMITNYLSQFK